MNITTYVNDTNTLIGSKTAPDTISPTMVAERFNTLAQVVKDNVDPISQYQTVTGTALPNIGAIPIAHALLAAGTYTQTTGGSLVLTATFNVVTWAANAGGTGGTWSLSKAIGVSVDLSSYALKTDVTTAIQPIINNSYVEPLTGTVNGVYNVSGTVGALTGYSSYLYTLGGKIDAIFSLPQFNNQYICFFDSSGAFISSSRRTASAVNLSLRSIVPVNTWYVGFSWLNTTPLVLTSHLFYDRNDVDFTNAGGDTKIPSAAAVKGIKDNRAEILPAETGTGRFDLNLGTIDLSATTYKYAYYAYTNTSDLFLTANINVNNYRLFIYDINKVMIGYYAVGAAWVVTDVSLKTLIGDVPENTAYFGLSGTIAASTWTMKGKAFLDAATYTQLEGEIQAVLDPVFGNLKKVTAFSDDLTTVKADWINTAGWTFDTAAKTLTPTATGTFTTNFIQLNRSYSSAIKRMRIKVTLYSDTVMNIYFKSGNGVGFYQIDVPNALLKMYGSDGTTGVLTNVVSQIPITFPITSGLDYFVDVSKSNYLYRMSIIHSDTQAFNTLVYAGWAAGEQQRQYAFGLNAGTPFKISSVSVVLPLADNLFVGDSISNGAKLEPNYGSFMAKHTTLIGKRLGSYVISAMSGESGSFTAIDRFDVEYSFIKPKLIIVCIGTNSGFSATVANSFITKATAIGARVIFNYIPIIATSVAVNAVIDALPATNRGARFDKATAIGGVIANGKDNTLFVDGVHPNVAGSEKMRQRFFIDMVDL